MPLPPGAKRVRVSADLPSGVRTEIKVEVENGKGGWEELGNQPVQGPPLFNWLRQNLAARLFMIALALYLAVRLTALASFPIYFFSDEAVQTVLASDLVRDGFHGYSGEFLPTFFPNAGQYNLGASVYLQVIPYLLFGKAIWVTRGIAALVTILAALALGSLLKDVYQSKRAWLAVLALSAAPAWFLHSRTAFETALSATCYAVFLAAYLMYRLRSPRYLFLAMLGAALTCYSYSPAQIIVAASGLLFFLSDLPYHWKQRKMVLLAGLLGLALAAPYVRHQVLHPSADAQHLANLGSYWTSSMPLLEKFGTGIGIYLRGLNPFYWFIPHEQDLARHTMHGWGHLLPLLLPFFLIGLGLAIWRFKRPEMRILLLSWLAAPLGAVPVDLGVTRVLIYVMPATVLIALGLDASIQWLTRPVWPKLLSLPRFQGIAALVQKIHMSEVASATAVFTVLSLTSLVMLNSALSNGPTWYPDYSMSGMQYGAQQVFDSIHEQLAQNPGTHIILSPTWANGADVLARYFLGDPLPIQVDSLRAFSDVYQPITDNDLFILPAYEYREISRDKFAKVQVESVLHYPNGQPGFYYLRLGYVPNIQEILTNETQQRLQPVSESLQIRGQTVNAVHTSFDIGSLQNALDGDLESLVRSAQINPMQIDLNFEAPLTFSGLSFKVGGVPTTVRVKAVVHGESQPRSWEQSLPQDPDPRFVTIDFGAPLALDSLHIEILNSKDGPEANVHLWEIQFKEK
jgi:4-amino-4-deoxy-L-arabinose transferase-like glycosyltransferase